MKVYVYGYKSNTTYSSNTEVAQRGDGATEAEGDRPPRLGAAPENIPPVIDECVKEVVKLGCGIVWNPKEADVAIAPLLTRKISDEEIKQPKLGTLIFHPSLLSRHHR